MKFKLVQLYVKLLMWVWKRFAATEILLDTLDKMAASLNEQRQKIDALEEQLEILTNSIEPQYLADVGVDSPPSKL